MFNSKAFIDNNSGNKNIKKYCPTIFLRYSGVCIKKQYICILNRRIAGLLPKFCFRKKNLTRAEKRIARRGKEEKGLWVQRAVYLKDYKRGIVQRRWHGENGKRCRGEQDVVEREQKVSDIGGKIEDTDQYKGANVRSHEERYKMLL